MLTILDAYKSYRNPLVKVSEGLIESEASIHSFDAMAKVIIKSRDVPKSVDAIAIDNEDSICFIEFKGVNDNVQSMSSKCMYIDKHPECKYAKRFYTKCQEEIKSSIRLKALESWMTVESFLLPEGCSLNSAKCKLMVVVGDSLSVLMEVVEDLSGKNTDGVGDDDFLTNIGNALKTYRKKPEKGISFYFDEITVCTSNSFIEEILPTLRLS